ncbi:hypothetical protein [Burkholderia ambifaria]|uniref:hypothetical protein n=1 Tax=Burkholderia ambifaria TaxID=152480 RepID=UPI00158BA76B|nr:hypothetical protein [Burkholderia ambifaria]
MPTIDNPPKQRGFLKRLFGPKVETRALTVHEQTDALMEGLSFSTLLGSSKRPARNRQQIYMKWNEMAGDPIISTALRLHVTAALGGHETSGDVVFIETEASAAKDERKVKIATEISNDLGPLFNRIAYTVAFNGAAFGDAYGRIYLGPNGVADVYVDELVHPATVIPYEQGNKTVGFVTATSERGTERLDRSQMARLKMPRTLYTPQVRAIEKAIRTMLTEDEIDNLPLMPSSAGGSFLDAAEGPYDNLYAALVSLVGQRVLDSIDETMFAVNMDGMTKQQQKSFLVNFVKILKASKKRADDAVKRGKPVLERIFHLIPTWGEKQLTAINGTGANGAGRGPNGNISVEDVMLYAKLLAGTLGIDLSMLGFSELLSGGLGDGGFFRTSAQAAERSRLLRVGLTEFYNAIIDVHTHHRYGHIFEEAERPWSINFYGTISALESERQRTKTEAMNTSIMLGQAIEQFKGLGLSEKTLIMVLSKIMTLDEDQARAIAKDVIAEMERRRAEEAAGGGF